VTAITDRNVVLVKGQVAYVCDSASARADPGALAAYLGV
jgi:ABC-type branched-subunit amino acid transport system ATPase component